MRDILFRGKTKGGKWVEGVYSPYNWGISLEREDKPLENTEVIGNIHDNPELLEG